VEGREAVVQSWLGQGIDPTVSSRDEAGTYDASYRAIAVDRDLPVATGTTTYLASPDGLVDKVYDICFVIRFDRDETMRGVHGMVCEAAESVDALSQATLNSGSGRPPGAWGWPRRACV
jgi:hypothetical protein